MCASWKRREGVQDQTLIAGKLPGSSGAVSSVNPPVHRFSTTLYKSLDELWQPSAPYIYGRRGSPTSRALEEALSKLEQGDKTCLYPSGLSAISGVLQGLMRPGDHFLMVDCAYGLTRQFAEKSLKPNGIEVQYFSPTRNTDVASFFRKNTRAVYLESPASQTFQVQDIPAIAKVAKEHGILVIVDNTWATSYFLKPLCLGADVSVQSLTKYVAGHSDVMLGSATFASSVGDKIAQHRELTGICVAPDDAYLALRGLRTLAVRLERHQSSAIKVATQLSGSPIVDTIFYPALPDDPGHALWSRDFLGASGTFSIALNEAAQPHLGHLFDTLEFFGIGYSYGGFESLIAPMSPNWLMGKSGAKTRPVVRLHIGLEQPDDLIRDLFRGLDRLTAVIQKSQS